MGRFIERYKKHPERGKDYYFNQMSAYAASITLGRDFGEGVDHFFNRCPDAAKAYQEIREDRQSLDQVIT
jgi:hypothetical protein